MPKELPERLESLEASGFTSRQLEAYSSIAYRELCAHPLRMAGALVSIQAQDRGTEGTEGMLEWWVNSEANGERSSLRIDR